jgi:two-component system chemotaxis response regulator CheB
MIVIAASAGGIEALSQLAGALPGDVQAALFVVVHIPANSPSALPNILNRRSAGLHAMHPANGQQIQYGHIYIAPPDQHMLVGNGHVHIVHGPRENRSRPAADPLFRTAARAYGPRVIGVVLTGNLDDGTAGLMAVKRRGGIAVVQDPDDAPFPGMPRSALEHVPVDHSLPLSDLPALLMRLVQEPAPDEAAYPIPEDIEVESDIAEAGIGTMEQINKLGTPSILTCPECHGSLFELREGQLVRYRCQVGHAFSAESLFAEQSDNIEAVLWAALRALEEKADLARRIAKGAREQNRQHIAARFEVRSKEAEENVEQLRRILSRPTLTDDPSP